MLYSVASVCTVKECRRRRRVGDVEDETCVRVRQRVGLRSD